MSFRVVMYGDPVLRQPAQPVKEFNQQLSDIADAMLETMYEARGIGLAAQQVGLTEALCVLDVPPESDVDDDDRRLNPDIEMPIAMVNPELLESSGETWSYDEGCLSFPDITGKVVRPWKVKIRYQDLEGKAHEIEAQGLVGRAILHEMDHLNGVLFVDRMSNAKRLALAGKMKRLKQRTTGA